MLACLGAPGDQQKFHHVTLGCLGDSEPAVAQADNVKGL